MDTLSTENILENYLHWWGEHTQEMGKIHGQFLELRQAGLKQMAGKIGQQVKTICPPVSGHEPVLFTLDDLNEFATGSVAKCLGQEYAIYAGRRSPRIPNGDLLLMSRIPFIRGSKGVFDQTSTIAAEYEVPSNAWYLEGDERGRLPISICIELALQPCGFLSAYLGTALQFPEVDYYFRNLDGEATFNHSFDARGKTILARAELLKTFCYGSTIIQYFTFELKCNGEVFFEGKSSFGYFSSEGMAAQTGLDGGKIVLPWIKQGQRKLQILPIQGSALEADLPQGKLRLIDDMAIDHVGGDKQEGYVYASRENNPKDWFYSCHFHEDPVMPGSLGIEAIVQAMKVYSRSLSKQTGITDFVTGQKVNWSYRGQVLQHHRKMQLEVHFHKTRQDGTKKVFTGDASLWADDSRIYELRNMCLAVEEAQD